MAELFIEHVRYVSLASTALYESEYETLIADRAADLFRGFTLVPFKVDVESPLGRRRPDFALVENSYQSWWVVEVELSHHSLRGHVVPQVEVFQSASYGEIHVQHLLRQHDGFDEAALRNMMLGASPRVLVIVDRIKQDWLSALAPFDALVCVVEVFRADRGAHCLRVNGERPRPTGEVLSLCRRDPILPRSWIIDSPAAVPVQDGEILEIQYEGSSTSWRRRDTADTSYLMPVKDNPVRDGSRSLQLIETVNGLLLEANE